MARTQRSTQELIARRRRQGFVGRGAERAAFRENLDLPPDDERHRFLFHVHGNAGVGKTFLVRELEQLARERGAPTAYIDESVGSVPEAMAELAEQFARQGHRFKELERLLAAHRERRHEAAAVVAAGTEPGEPSAASMAAARATLVGLGLVPGIGAFAGALDPAQLAQGADRLRAGLGSRLRSQEDVQLVLAPERVLTPVLLRELADTASEVPWIVLVLDTYERTGPVLDGWLHEVLTTDRYGASLPENTVVVTAGQLPLAPARWGGLADFVTEVPLGPFTETEARGLLAGKGVVAEPVVADVLRLTGGLPLLVSTLAEQRPADPDDIGDPSATAVERFLKWEQDPLRRAAALTCAFPRRLDAEVFRAAADCPEEGADALFGWLRGLPFVDDRGTHVRYHDLVREQMLRLQRRRSPRGWTERHDRLAEAFGHRREEAAADLAADDEWEHEPWRELRLEETYHRLCARPRAVLPEALRDAVAACRESPVIGRRWARTMEEAGGAADAPAVRDWGRALREALADDTAGVTAAVRLLLDRPGLDDRGRAMAHALHGRELRGDHRNEDALAAYDRALELDPTLVRAHYGRAVTLQATHDFTEALAAVDRADRLAPDTYWIVAERAETHRLAGRFEDAVAEFDRALALHPDHDIALAGRAACRHALGRFDEALADFDRAIRLDENYLWARVRRARLRGAREQWDEAFADLDQVVALAPDSAWAASERGDAYRQAGRHEDAVTELGRALALEPDHTSALASRGASRLELGRAEEALADLNRAVELYPDYIWALVRRARARRLLDDLDGMFEDLRRVEALDGEDGWAAAELGEAYRLADRPEEAVTALRRAVEQDPRYDYAWASLGAAYHSLRDHAQALRCLDRALELDPDYRWALARRARVGVATGRLEQALADVDRCAALGQEADWARRTAVELLMHQERWEEAAARLSGSDGAALPDDEAELLRAELHWRTGEWTAAREAAERIRATDPLNGVYLLALTAGRAEGTRAAEPLWREFAQLVPQDGRLTAGELVSARCIAACALSDWPEADRRLAEAPAADQDWDDLANLAQALTDLLNSPDADTTRLTPRLARVTRARDALRSRHTDLPPPPP
ncbi:tetratricopeptide repeat protein [Streptomyces sp. NPDC005820]|uniref:tetratricopeptide repeat protein n=1 Tax=Streptomyces sp. NPDC005820 TaxID=3157069 RepID=UPI0033F0A10C